jgi:hypothetical protein
MNRFTVVGGVLSMIFTLIVLQVGSMSLFITAAIISTIGNLLIYYIGMADGSRRTVRFLRQELNDVFAEYDARQSEPDDHATGQN